MCPPQLSLFLGLITITDEDTTSPYLSECSSHNPQSHIFNKIRYEPASQSLLSLLDDKNKTITALKKQIQNQKSQLTYYIKKEMNYGKVEELSASCSPQASDENLPLSLAISKFCRQAGIKTKLSALHDRMHKLDGKISAALKDQEFILRKIVNKLCEFVKTQNTSRSREFRIQFGSFLTDPYHVDLFNKLLAATVHLRRRLDGFKICCNRLVLVEEERNSIVDQVYSVPVKDRMDYNYLLGIQMEKAALENEIKRISERRSTSRHRLRELNVIEKILHDLQWELNNSLKNDEETCINKMLKKINSEARMLLEMTREQKRRVEAENSKINWPDPERVVLVLNMASDGEISREELAKCGIKENEEIRFYELIKNKMDSIRKQILLDATRETKKIAVECDALKGKIARVLCENGKTKSENRSLKRELNELKSEQKSNFERVKQERDAYKSQVDDLQAIREAYAHLVDKQPNMSKIEREFLEQIETRDRKIFELQNHLLQQNKEIEKLNAKILNQNDQIVTLNRYISSSRHHTYFPNPDERLPKLANTILEKTIPKQDCCPTKRVENVVPKGNLTLRKSTKPSIVYQPTKKKMKTAMATRLKIAKASYVSKATPEESVKQNEIVTKEKCSSLSSMQINTSANLDNGIDEFELYRDCPVDSEEGIKIKHNHY